MCIRDREETFYIDAPQIERRQEAKDGTVKYLLRMADGNCIEALTCLQERYPEMPVALPIGIFAPLLGN